MSAVMWDYDSNNFEMVHSYAATSGKLPSNALSTHFESDLERRWVETIRNLIIMRNLPDNWDGEDSEAPPPELIDSILAYIDILRGRGVPSPSRVSASPNGDVLLEWQEGDVYYEAEFSEPYNVEWMLKENNSPAIHWEENLAQETLFEKDYFLTQLSSVV